MNKPLPDSWEQERHHSLKRWERGVQRVAWRQRGAELAAPPLPCPWRPNGSLATTLPTLKPAHVLALFAGDLTIVRFAGGERQGGIRVLRGGLPWEQWCPLLLNAYRHGAPVPPPFRPRLRLPTPWLEQASTGSPANQRGFFDRLRTAGVLPPLRPMTEEALAPWLRWDEVRGRLLDFKTEI